MIKDVDLTIYKWSYQLDKEYAVVQDMCTKIKLYNTLKNITTELQFEYVYEYDDYDFNIEVGDIAILNHQGLMVFYGKVTDTEYDYVSNSYKVTCYDYSWWLIKNNMSYCFENISARNAINVALGESGIKHFKTASDDWKDIMLENHVIKNKSCKDVLNAIMSDITRKTGKYYYIHMDYYDGNIVITECDKYFSYRTIQSCTGKDYIDGNLIDYEIKRSMQNMVNQVKILDKDYKEIECEQVRPFNGARYGTIQDTIVLDEKTDLAKARLKASKTCEDKGYPSEEIIVKCLGDINYRVGYGVLVKLPYSYFDDKFMYIISSEWEWTSNGDFISKLSLSSSNKHELYDWEDIEENKAKALEDGILEGGDGNVESAVQWMINIANDDVHGYSQANRWGPDYDCSSLVISGYEQAGIPLKTNGATYTGDMREAALKTGFDLIKWTGDASNLKRGDILLDDTSPASEQHVECYIGDGKKVGAHSNYDMKTGDSSGREINITELGDRDWSIVLRYPASKSTSNGKYSEKLVEFAKGWEKFYDHVYDDGAGNATIGWGDTHHTSQGTCTREEAEGWLRAELDECANYIYKKLSENNISLSQNKFDCIVDMRFNIVHSASDKIISMVINGASDDDICNQIMQYTHDGAGNEMPGLVKRCKSRVNMWRNGVYNSDH